MEERLENDGQLIVWVVLRHMWIVKTPGGLRLISLTDVALNMYVRLIATSIIYTRMCKSTGGSR